ncbi:MAG: GIY-YIG nuclease family protein [Prevotellaceae bacterium]|nr:GIY-YIG nuclease family protein [Prevotellaceae bacterium]
MENSKTFTIHTELINGKLEGARNIYMGANPCHLYVIPRAEITLADSIPNIFGQSALYILLGPTDVEKPLAYIGQTTDFANRKNDHVQKKDFWNTALVFISDNHQLYGDDVRYLEYLGIKEAQKNGTFKLLNSANPKKPSLPTYRTSDMTSFFSSIRFLCTFYGCGIFENTQQKATQKIHTEHLYFIQATNRPAKGCGFYNEQEKRFTLLKGSILATNVAKSFQMGASRDKFIKEHCKTNKGEIVLLHDVSFDSPSRASNFVLGRPSNGWNDWKDSDGKKLGDRRLNE